MTMVEQPRALGAARAMQLIEDAGVKVRPNVAARIKRMHLDGHNFLVIDEDDVYFAESEMSVFGAMLDAEGVLCVLPLGEVRSVASLADQDDASRSPSDATPLAPVNPWGGAPRGWSLHEAGCPLGSPDRESTAFCTCRREVRP